MAGYSKRSLQDKLGIKDGFQVCFLNEPESYRRDLGALPSKTVESTRLKKGIDFIHHFCVWRKDLEKNFPKLASNLSPSGMVWISWPKGSSKVPTDLNGNIVRDIGVMNGMVDVKVCAVDDIWSGLKFVYRLKDRPPV